MSKKVSLILLSLFVAGINTSYAAPFVCPSREAVEATTLSEIFEEYDMQDNFEGYGAGGKLMQEKNPWFVATGTFADPAHALKEGQDFLQNANEPLDVTFNMDDGETFRACLYHYSKANEHNQFIVASPFPEDAVSFLPKRNAFKNIIGYHLHRRTQ